MNRPDQRPRISIIIPVLDEAAGVVNALQPLQALRTHSEIIVVDGGSKDGTLCLAQPLVDRVLSAPRGRGSQMNAGAAVASADVLVFLHADTRLPEKAPDLISHALAQGAIWGRFDVRIDSPLPGLAMVAFMMNWRSRLTGIATGDQAIFAKHSAFTDINGFPDIPLMEDLVFSKRLLANGRPACLRDKVTTSGRRWEKHGLLRTILRMWRLRLRFYFGANPTDLAREYGYTPREN